MKTWEFFFEEILEVFSKGKHEPDLLQAKEEFFKKLGRSHEMRTDYYEAVSQSFLEWYIFDFRCQFNSKTPAVLFLARQYGSAEQRQRLHQALFHHWSIFKVEDHSNDEVLLDDLLFKKKRRLRWDETSSDFKLWKVKKGQYLQTRLFQSPAHDSYFSTHIWLHPDSEHEILDKVCEKLSSVWGLHRDFLKDALESLIRSLGLRDQMVAMRSKNWIYQDLWKRYAEAK